MVIHLHPVSLFSLLWINANRDDIDYKVFIVFSTIEMPYNPSISYIIKPSVVYDGSNANHNVNYGNYIQDYTKFFIQL